MDLNGHIQTLLIYIQYRLDSEKCEGTVSIYLLILTDKILRKQ
jgi:hypothetical protein